MDSLLPPDNARHIEIGGIPTFLFEAGKGPAVLLLHGASVGVDAWLTWFRCFYDLARHHRVIAYDQPCFGQSGIPADGRYMDREARADHAQAVLDHLGLSDVVLVGHSEGGFIATRLAITNREKVRKFVIVTSGGTSPRLHDDRDAAWMSASSAVYDYVGRGVDENTYVRSEGHLKTREDPAFETILRRSYRRALASGTAKCMIAASQAQTGYSDYTAVQERALFPYLFELEIPALLIWAGGDPTVPVARGLALADMLPRSEFHVFPRAGHWVMHEEAEGFNRLLQDWIAG
jgi:pimeloyl-ACP methyl ester carboxylesterase